MLLADWLIWISTPNLVMSDDARYGDALTMENGYVFGCDLPSHRIFGVASEKLRRGDAVVRTAEGSVIRKETNNDTD